jgi:hypothetical protein
MGSATAVAALCSGETALSAGLNAASTKQIIIRRNFGVATNIKAKVSCQKHHLSAATALTPSRVNKNSQITVKTLSCR